MSSHRRFLDETGREWDVWEVRPVGGDARVTPARGSGVQSDGDGEWQSREMPKRLPELLQAGWLAFEADGERRRLAPIPSEWMALDLPELRRLLASSERTGG